MRWIRFSQDDDVEQLVAKAAAEQREVEKRRQLLALGALAVAVAVVWMAQRRRA